MYWQPSASNATLARRAALLAQLREFFAQRDILEVQTPHLTAHANSDPHIESLEVSSSFGRAWLHTSPEFFMKRLLAAGSGAIYQVGPVWRDAERGPRHAPEFTMAEWYRPGFDDAQLRTEVAELLHHVTGRNLLRRDISYHDALQRHAGVGLDADIQALAMAARKYDLDVSADLDRQGWRDLLFSHLVEPALEPEELTFVYDFPTEQSALARLHSSPVGQVAARFELFYRGLELANGYWELADADEQRARFEVDNVVRRQRGQIRHPPDENLLAALTAGMPDCAGVALGVDRLLMVLAGLDHIDQVQSFPALFRKPGQS